MLRILSGLLLVLPLLSAQTQAPKDPFQSLHFLEGTWEAKTGNSASGANAIGSYTFRKELAGHVLARHSSATGCKGPVDFDCDHGDLLYVYQDAPAQPLQAIYFDNEGHTIHYAVSTPTQTSVIFLSDASPNAPQFRLTYQLKGAIMEGKFQMKPPGQSEWISYLEWSGGKK